MALTRDGAFALMTEYTQSDSLRKHMLAVEAAVRGYARLWGENEADWGLVALLARLRLRALADPWRIIRFAASKSSRRRGIPSG